MWLGGKDHPAPWAYVELILCRDVYHCTPVDLAGIPADTVIAHLTLLEVEATVRDMQGDKFEHVKPGKPAG